MNTHTLQTRLNLTLALDPPLDVDGILGPLTREAILAFQAQHVGPDGRPLTVDGIPGPLTQWALTTNVQAVPSDQLTPFVRRGRARCELGDRAIDVMVAELRAGAREVNANNEGPFVEKYLAPLGRTSGAWCAGITSFAVHTAAAELGREAPFAYSGTARGILNELARKGLTYEPGELTPMCGDLMVWWRGTPDGWQGHIEPITDYEAGVVWTIGGNRGGYPAPVRQFSYVLEREQRLLGLARLCEAP